MLFQHSIIFEIIVKIIKQRIQKIMLLSFIFRKKKQLC